MGNGRGLSGGGGGVSPLSTNARKTSNLVGWVGELAPISGGALHVGVGVGEFADEIEWGAGGAPHSSASLGTDRGMRLPQ